MSDLTSYIPTTNWNIPLCVDNDSFSNHNHPAQSSPQSSSIDYNSLAGTTVLPNDHNHHFSDHNHPATPIDHNQPHPKQPSPTTTTTPHRPQLPQQWPRSPPSLPLPSDRASAHVSLGRQEEDHEAPEVSADTSPLVRRWKKLMILRKGRRVTDGCCGWLYDAFDDAHIGVLLMLLLLLLFCCKERCWYWLLLMMLLLLLMLTVFLLKAYAAVAIVSYYDVDAGCFFCYCCWFCWLGLLDTAVMPMCFFIVSTILLSRMRQVLSLFIVIYSKILLYCFTVAAHI